MRRLLATSLAAVVLASASVPAAAAVPDLVTVPAGTVDEAALAELRTALDATAADLADGGFRVVLSGAGMLDVPGLAGIRPGTDSPMPPLDLSTLHADLQVGDLAPDTATGSGSLVAAFPPFLPEVELRLRSEGPTMSAWARVPGEAGDVWVKIDESLGSDPDFAAWMLARQAGSDTEAARLGATLLPLGTILASPLVLLTRAIVPASDIVSGVTDGVVARPCDSGAPDCFLVPVDEAIANAALAADLAASGISVTMAGERPCGDAFCTAIEARLPVLDGESTELLTRSVMTERSDSGLARYRTRAEVPDTCTVVEEVKVRNKKGKRVTRYDCIERRTMGDGQPIPDPLPVANVIGEITASVLIDPATHRIRSVEIGHGFTTLPAAALTATLDTPASPIVIEEPAAATGGAKDLLAAVGDVIVAPLLFFSGAFDSLSDNLSTEIEDIVTDASV